jgi:hypothetical protein
MSEILRIISGERYAFNTGRIEQTYAEVLEASEANIIENINLAKATLCGHDWELLTEKEVIEIESNFLSTYKKVPVNKKFYFSFADRCKTIGLEKNRLRAVYLQDGMSDITQFRGALLFCWIGA